MPRIGGVFRPAGGLAVTSLLLAALVVALELVELAAALPSGRTIAAAAGEGVAPLDVLTPYDAVGPVLLLALTAAWIVTSVWLTRARENAEVLHPFMQHTRSAPWAWLGWVVPVVSLWFPFQLVRDVRRATCTDGRQRSSIVGWWWAAWLLYLVTSSPGTTVTTGTTPNAHAAGQLAGFEAVNAAVAATALALWIRIVIQVWRSQDEVARNHPAPSPPWAW